MKKPKAISQIQSLASLYPNLQPKMRRKISQNLGSSALWMNLRNNKSQIRVAIPFSNKKKANPIYLRRIKTAAAQTSLSKIVDSLLNPSLKKKPKRRNPNPFSVDGLVCLTTRRMTQIPKILQINNQVLYFKIRVRLNRKICSLNLTPRTISSPKTTGITSSRTSLNPIMSS